MASHLSAPYFHDEAAAFAELEANLWPNGPICPRCNGTDRITVVRGARMGLRRCGPCKRQFTVTVGTVFESSHVPLNQWLQAVYLMCSSKKGISSHQLMRILDVQYKTAWFMTHRIREAMKSGNLPPIGGTGKVVEADETYIGTKEGSTKRRGHLAEYEFRYNNRVGLGVDDQNRTQIALAGIVGKRLTYRRTSGAVA